ncbi:MAG: hypothetical protein KGJ86_05055, partial [Chloroflexota bacterium]|nr:hypothetical protein [Chloroflexota bacterium]
EQTDPVTNRTDGLLTRLSRKGQFPKVMHVNTSAEYANLAAALIHVSPDGRTDSPIPDNVRVYHLAGTHHGGGALPLGNRVFSNAAAYYNNSIDYRPLLRAAFRNLDAWVTEGKDPPPSRYPRLSSGTLVDPGVVRDAAARLPGPGMPLQRLYPTQRLHYGPESGRGLATNIPPVDGGAYPELLPAVDDDVNEVSGVRHPDVAVPLATYTGWNPRHPEIGGSEMNLLLNGATIPFARTLEERRRSGDDRPSIQERYETRRVFLDRIRRAAVQLAREAYLLESDVEAVVEASGQRYDQFMRLEGPLPSASLSPTSEEDNNGGHRRGYPRA